MKYVAIIFLALFGLIEFIPRAVLFVFFGWIINGDVNALLVPYLFRLIPEIIRAS